MQPRDPYDARGLLLALAERIDSALERLDEPRRCERVLPRIDGTAAVVIRGESTVTYDWIAPPTPGPESADVRGWHWGQLSSPSRQGEDPVARLLSSTLARALSQPVFSALRWVNRHETRLRFDDAVVDLMLADRLAPGRSRWYQHVFQDAFQERAERFRLRFSGPTGEVVFEVSAPGVAAPDGEVVLRHRLFELWLVEDQRPARDREQVPAQVERYLAFLLSRGVHEAMQPAAEAFVTSNGGGLVDPKAPSWRGAPVSTSRWGNPLQWHQFFSDFEVARSGLCNVQFQEAVSYVIHGERECLTVEPQLRPYTHTFARMPFAEHSLERGDQTRSREYVSLITEQETVLGGDQRLEDTLRAAAQDPATHLVVLNNTCLPKMVGDDVGSLVERLQRDTDKPILSLNTDLHSPDASYKNLLAQAEARTLPFPESQRPSPGTVCLLGYGPGRHRDELRELLARLDLPRPVFLMPELSVGKAWLYRHGAVQVIYPRDTWRELHTQLFGELDQPVVDVPAPYGIRDTRAWLRGIAQALGRESVLQERWDALVGDAERELAALRAQVGAARVAAVVDAASASRLVQPERLYGVRLLPLLEELGFGLDVLLLADGDEDPEAELEENPEAELRRALQDPERLQIHAFRSPAELAERLAQGTFSLVYSEVACDARLSRAGKTGFGLQAFEMGPRGAVRSLRRLLELHRFPFYRRYARYFDPRTELGEGDHEP
ncbi:MAG: nitrogenase component 1 [bacterium]